MVTGYHYASSCSLLIFRATELQLVLTSGGHHVSSSVSMPAVICSVTRQRSTGTSVSQCAHIQLTVACSRDIDQEQHDL